MNGPSSTLANDTEVSFGVTGMTCASCVRRIEKALGRVDADEARRAEWQHPHRWCDAPPALG
jgi:cation transport ATPase